MPFTEQDVLRVLEASRAISSTLQLSEVLKTVMGLAGAVVHAQASALLLRDPLTEELYFDVALGERGAAVQQMRLKRGEGIAGWVAENKKAAVVNDVANDPRWTDKADQKSKFATRSILAVPMLVRDKLVGVMEAINRSDGQPFSDSDLQLLEAFAAQAAVAIENARLFESVRQEKEKMATVFGEMTNGAFLLDAEGKVLLGNPAGCALLGREVLEEFSWKDLEAQFRVAPNWEEVRTYLGGAGGIEIVRGDPPQLVLAGVINQICSDRGQVTGYLVIFRDVTEERRESLMKKNFLSLVSHKLRTPLVAIRGYLPFLLEKPEELTDFQKQSLETIDRNSQQLASLIEKLTWFSIIESQTMTVDLKPRPLSAAIDGAVLELAYYLKSTGAHIVIDPTIQHMPAVAYDTQWMKQVLRNLIENAVKFNRKPAPEVHLSAKDGDDNTLQLLIRDNGPGIAPEETGKIFQKFYQIESSFTGQVDGMGLGLAFVKRVVEEHGARIHVDSTLGQGSTFIISFPRP